MSRTDRIVTRSETETAQAGRVLADAVTPGTTVLLLGDLGAGKTAFVRGLAAGFGIDPDDVSSPTFTIVQEYRGPRITLQHVDLYRLSPAEIDDLALDDLLDDCTVMAIEWAERLPTRPFGPVIAVRLSPHAHGREIAITRNS